jgi:MFS family permease
MHLSDYHQVRHHLFRMKYTELNEIYYFMSFRSFALSLITIFLPIFLYQGGFGISNIFLLYGLMYFFELCFEYPSGALLKKWGPKHGMIISLPFLIFHLWQIITISSYQWPIWTIALSGGLSLAFYWQSYHYDFSRSKRKSRATGDVAKLYIIMSIFGASAPLLGGLIASLYGMKALLSVVSLLFFVASFFLFRTKDRNFRKGKLNLSKIDIKVIKKDLISYAGMGWESVAAGQIWPLFLGLVVSSYAKLGLVTSLALLLTVVITYWTGKRSDKGKRIDMIRYGSFANAIVSVGQIFVETTTQAFAANMGRSLAQSMQISPFDSEYYLHADEESRSEYLFLMESAVDLSRAILHAILFAISFYFSVKTVLIIGLVLGAFGSVLVPLIPPAKCEQDMKNAKIKLMPKPIK